VLVRPDKALGTFPIFVAATQLPGMLDEFAIGIILAKFVRSPTGGRFLIWMKSPLKWFCLLLLSSGTIYLAMQVFWSRSNYWDDQLMVVFYRTLLALGFGAILLLACSTQLVGRLKLVVSPFAYLGTISYGIYLWHLPILLSLKRVQWLTAQQLLPLTICITCILASVSWHFFEQPILKKYGR
jgi:peptidoglycan/LPS O-acetylase OafA/YrhL